jgi:putative restriction endonuclease
MIRLYIANTDLAWFNFLSQQQPLDEVNHWQPGGRLRFNALAPGELLVFRLKSPINRIAGYGVFARGALLPINLAWTSFGLKNGHPDFASFKSAIARLNPENRGTIGFRVLTQPVFLPKDEWFEPPSDWPTHVQGGKRYSTDTPEGRHLWERLGTSPVVTTGGFAEPAAMFGAPTLVRPRLGQGAFRVGVIEAYDRRCVVTGERTLPALEAAHIVPVTQQGMHEVSNGLLLRRDLHALFDEHYITITAEKAVVVSRRIREEFENGRDYYALHGKRIRDPKFVVDAPSVEALRRHNDLFVG